MSPRAAWRLETLGFTDVYDYVGGKVDWFGAGWPREGSGRSIRLVDLADRSVPTCGLGEQAGAVLGRLGEWDVCIVVNQERVVLGVVGVDALEASDDRAVGEVMNPAPSTWRPHLSVKQAAAQLEKNPRPLVVVTQSDGRLVGVVSAQAISEAATLGAPAG
jgi:CBS domain-containing protein